ncbi:MAG: response regulator [Melioribacteraceae bacterium]|nr:response regulator [Melioribacteraceae bacterium]
MKNNLRINNESNFDPSFLNNQINNTFVILEDEKSMQKDIANILRNIFKMKVITTKNPEYAVKYAKSKEIINFIVDINLGKNKSIEGLNALEKIKNINRNCFVGIYSNYPKLYQKYAQKLLADVFVQKSRRTEDDVLYLVTSFYNFWLKLFQVKYMLTSRELIKLNKPNQLTFMNIDNNEMARDYSLDMPEYGDLNYLTFLKYNNDSQFIKQFLNYFIAIINGKLEDYDLCEKKLRIRVREKYPNENKYISKVGEEIITDELPAIYEV